MADNLETSGLNIVAQGADKATTDIGKVNKAFEGFGKTIGTLARDIASGASFDKITQDIANIGGATSNATGLLAGLGQAGSASGAGVALGMAGAVAAIAAVAAAAGAAILAVRAIGDAVGQAISYARDVSRIQDSTGLSAGPAQSLMAGASVTGNSVGAVSGTFNAIDKNIDDLGTKSEKAFGTMAAAADKADVRLGRLNDDYKAGVADTIASAAARIADINEKLTESHAAMLARQARLDEDYNRETEQGRAALGQRIADIEASTAASIASLTQRRSRGTDDYVRETEAAQQDLAQSILDINTGLNDRLTQLRQSAADDNASIIDNGAAKQASITEALQSKLASIEEKYSNKRQSIQEKIYDPNTNPILRAFYKTQLGAINGLQKAEELGARMGASAKEAAARRETENQLAEVQRRLQREEALEQTQAQRAIARQQQEATQRQAERLREYTQQQADLAAQIAAENAQRAQQIERARADQAVREADLKRSYDRSTADAKASYDKQVADATDAQAKIVAETQKRLDAEKQQFDRATADIEASLAKIASGGGSGASAAAVGLNKLAEGFKALGISQAEWEKLKPDEKLKLLNDRIHEMVANGDIEGAKTMVQNLGNVSREAAGSLVDASEGAREVDDVLKKWGLTQDQIDALKKAGVQFGAVEEAVKLLVIQFATALIPIFITLIGKFMEFWKEHGPKVLQAISDVAKFVVKDAVPAIGSFFKGLGDLYDGAVKVSNWFDNNVTPAIRAINKSGIDLHDFLVGAFHLAWDNTAKDIQKVVDAVNFVKSKFEEFIRFLGSIQIPEWLKAGLNPGGYQAPRFTNNATNYSAPYGSGGSAKAQSIPATGAQMAASNVTNTKATTNTNSGNTAYVTVKVDNTNQGNVTKGVSDALFKAGFSVVR